MEKASDFFDTWLKSQEQFIENWTVTAKKLQESFLSLSGNKEETADTTGHGVSDLYNSWTNAVVHALKENGDSYLNIVKEILAKTFGSSHAYTKLYDIWLPLARLLCQRSTCLSLRYFEYLLNPFIPIFDS